MKIVHAVISLDVGGMERLVLGLIREGRKAGHEAAVVCTQQSGELAKAAVEAGAEVHSLGKPPGRRGEFIHLGRELLERLAPDVVHTHQISAAWCFGPGAASLGIPVVHTEHGNHFSRQDGWLAGMKRVLLYRLAARRIDRFCCVSAEIAGAVTRRRIAPASKVVVVPNGVDLEAFEGLPPQAEARNEFGIPADAFVLGTVGRLVEVKRQDFLLRAAAELRRRFADLWVLLVGDGPERANLEALAGELGIGDRCVFAGFQERPEIGLRAMDVFALTSRSEGFPVSLLEAWAAGVPVVAPKVGGIPDVVSHDDNGLLFKPNDFAGFCGAVGRLIDEPRSVAAMVEAARAEVNAKYSLARMAQTYATEYAALKSSHVGAAACAS
jgi:glycosyltransferase involved in cell wall biosynthesis